MTNREIAQEISSRIGNSPVPFDSVYSIALQIYNELGGEETQFDSVYSILLEILPLVEGGGGGNAIEEVDELPEDPAENKDKLFRLDNGDKGVYAAKLLSSETITTNRLPDEQQINKAYIWLEDDEPFYYKGAWKLILDDGEINGYGWLETYPDSDEWYLVFAQDNAVITTEETKTYDFSFDEVNDFDLENHTVTMEADVADYNWEYGGIFYESIIIPAIYNAPESAQIDNAYISSDDNMKFYYTGEETTIEIEGETINVYSWFKDGEGYIYSTKPASEIYYNDDEQSTPIKTDTKFYGGGEEWQIYVAYIVQLNASDSEQVGNAYINYPRIPNDHYIYNGVRTFNCTDGTLDLYEWEKDGYRLFTRIPASDLYEHAYATAEENITDVYTVDWSTYDIEATVAEFQTLLDNAYYAEYNCTTEKYTREETIEEWGWANILEGGSSLEAGDNISIEDNKISAIGYKADNSMTASFAELSELKSEPYTDMSSQMPSTDLYFTGDAGVTQYEVSGQLTAMIGSMVGMVAFQVGNGNIAEFIGFDSDNNIVTLDKSLDDNNALDSAQLSKLYMVVKVEISGDAGATTYTYTDSTGGGFMTMLNPNGCKIKFGDYKIVTVEDITESNITLSETLDAENAVSNAVWKFAINTNNIASGIASHAEGSGTIASGDGSHAEGQSTIAQNASEHAEGFANVSHTTAYEFQPEGRTIHSIGIGSGVAMRKNAFEVMKNGDIYVYGLGGYQGTNTKVQDPAIKTLQAYIASLEARINALEGNTTIE